MPRAAHPGSASTISRVIKASRPRTRYAVGVMATPLVLMRKWFGDRFFDMALNRLLSQYGRTRRPGGDRFAPLAMIGFAAAVSARLHPLASFAA